MPIDFLVLGRGCFGFVWGGGGRKREFYLYGHGAFSQRDVPCLQSLLSLTIGQFQPAFHNQDH